MRSLDSAGHRGLGSRTVNAPPLFSKQRIDKALNPMTDDNPDSNPIWPRWVRLDAAAAYLGLRRSTLLQKLSEGNGPKFYRSPGSRSKIFLTTDLDHWVKNSPERPLTPAERGRLAKLQAGAARIREERRARQQQVRETEKELV